VCAGEVPLLQSLHAAYAKRGVVFFGIPGDEEEAPVKQAVARLGIPWEQLFDARGSDAPLWTGFNVESQPSFYVFDREGRIAAKRATAEQLDSILAKLAPK
jgi:hypothetical protein